VPPPRRLFVPLSRRKFGDLRIRRRKTVWFALAGPVNRPSHRRGAARTGAAGNYTGVPQHGIHFRRHVRCYARDVRKLWLLAVTVVICAMSPRDARAWGRLAHRSATIVAERRLSSTARAAIRDLLDPGETLADASLWADEHRQAVFGSGAWHYVNVPIVELHYDARFCAPNGCVVSKIGELKESVGNAAAPREARQQALRLLIHLVEDLHQPVHVGDRGDRGGNDLQLRFENHGTNLHRLWDEEIVERHSTDESTWVAELDAIAKTTAARGWSAGTVESWADESLAAARRAYTVPGSAATLQPGAKIGDDYVEMALPIVERRLAQAAVRLSTMLNEIFQTRLLQ
jgi:hypothetical protein